MFGTVTTVAGIWPVVNRILAVGNTCLINNENTTSFGGGSGSQQMTFWVGHVTLFAHDFEQPLRL